MSVSGLRDYYSTLNQNCLIVAGTWFNFGPLLIHSQWPVQCKNVLFLAGFDFVHIYIYIYMYMPCQSGKSHLKRFVLFLPLHGEPIEQAVLNWPFWLLPFDRSAMEVVHFNLIRHHCCAAPNGHKGPNCRVIGTGSVVLTLSPSHLFRSVCSHFCSLHLTVSQGADRLINCQLFASVNTNIHKCFDFALILHCWLVVLHWWSN